MLTYNIVMNCRLFAISDLIYIPIEGLKKNLLSNCIGIVEVDLQELMFFSMISIERTEKNAL